MTTDQRTLTEEKESLYLGGGIKAAQRQHGLGKHTARERLDLLFDAGTFRETGLFVKHHSTDFGMAEKQAPADGVVTGFGRVNGHLVYAYAQDFTVLGGSLGEMHAAKIVKLQEEALRVGAPVVGMNDSGGARIQEGVHALAGYGRIFAQNIKASGIIPQICAIMGPCAGGAVYSPALMDFVFMVNGISQMFITGPRVLQAVTGESVSEMELGGAAVHGGISGCAHFCDDTEEACIGRIRTLLDYLLEKKKPFEPETADILRRDQNTDYIIPNDPRKPYKMDSVIEALADGGVFFEYQPDFAGNIRTGFIRLKGRTVGVIANEPTVFAGCLDINASDKAARFIRTCDAFRIPLLTLEDVPGYLPGKAQEHGGIIRHGAKLLYAYAEASVPKVTVITRKAFGGAYIGMCSQHLGADRVYAWPGVQIAVMGAEGAANIVFSKKIKASEDKEKTRKACIKEYEDKMMNPREAAAAGYVDDIILPSQTREIVTECFECLEQKQGDPVMKRHGNIPL